MNQTTRHGVFETNSSSSHSIAISYKGDPDARSMPVVDFFEDRAGQAHTNCIVLTGGEFGWGPEIYNDAFTKACYAGVYTLGRRDRADELRAMLDKVLKDVTGATEIVHDYNTDDWNSPNHSYIDHQSNGVGSDAFGSEEDLKAFIFNRGSTLVIDNDNH
jgi:pyruvate-formate lyase-activating enzyme